MATAGDYIVVVINGISIVVTVVGCILTILVIWTRPALRKLVNAPLVSLGCADILFVTLYSPSWIQQILNPQWEPPPALCWACKLFHKVPAEAFTVGQLLALLNGALNPVVYGVMNKNIRQGYKHIWDRVLNFIT
ncbi:alpha-2 adrenergic receptor-like [Branchiostoma floridae]|uniref:Alpha-2 adrenergic receptor-like n=1 Tax=Branchiostoma floridae TaxID=7739 RepID=A0A9J7KT56_BRAFL|nr:alpha-2 adrenergic receptor-like [Branchiostoma floridae]